MINTKIRYYVWVAGVAISQLIYAGDIEALLKAKNCLACHAIDHKIVGPAYQDVANKYRNNPEAMSLLTKKVIAGGAGAWGTMPMPPNPVSEAEAKQLVTWILSQK